MNNDIKKSLRQQCLELENANANATNTLNEVNVQMIQKSRELQGIIAQLEQKQKELESVEKKYHGVQVDLKDTQEKVGIARGELESIKQTITQMKTQIKQFGEENKEVETTNKRLLAENQTIKSTLLANKHATHTVAFVDTLQCYIRALSYLITYPNPQPICKTSAITELKQKGKILLENQCVGEETPFAWMLKLCLEYIKQQMEPSDIETGDPEYNDLKQKIKNERQVLFEVPNTVCNFRCVKPRV